MGKKNTNKSFIQRCSTFYNSLEQNFLIIFTLTIGALIIIEVVMRACGMQGFKWLEEMGRFMLVTTTLIGCSLAVKDNGHMLMDVLYTVLKPTMAYAFKSLVNLFCGAFYLYLGYYALQWTLKLYNIGKSMESIRFPSYIMWIFVCVGVITMGFRYLVQFKNSVMKTKNHVQEFNEMNTKEM